MKVHALLLLSTLTLGQAFAQDRLELNYSQSQEDYARVVMDVSFLCQTDDGKRIVLEGGVLKEALGATGPRLPALLKVRTGVAILLSGNSLGGCCWAIKIKFSILK